MKKTILLLSAVLLMSCSNDEKIVQVPVAGTNTMKVLGLSKGAAPGQPLDYGVSYGTSNDDSVYIQVSQAVYDYYYSKSLITPNPRWRGEITQD